jgi:hypothetical protein
MTTPLLLSLALLVPQPTVHAALKISHMSPVVNETRFPLRNSNPNELRKPGVDFRNVLTVSRDFGPDPEDIAIDGWVTRSADPKLEEVRIWFIRHDEKGRRHPFTRKVLKNLTIGYQRVDDEHWKVGFAAGPKQYLFDVELDDRGRTTIYGDVKAGRTTHSRCRIEKAHMVAKRVIGIPVGFKHLAVTCVDQSGVRHRGRVKSTRT